MCALDSHMLTYTYTYSIWSVYILHWVMADAFDLDDHWVFVSILEVLSRTELKISHLVIRFTKPVYPLCTIFKLIIVCIFR